MEDRSMTIYKLITGPIILLLYLIVKGLRWLVMQIFGHLLLAENWLNDRLLDSFKMEDKE